MNERVVAQWFNVLRDTSPETLAFRAARFALDERSRSLEMYSIVIKLSSGLTTFLTFDNGPQLWTLSPCCQSASLIIDEPSECALCNTSIPYALRTDVDEFTAGTLTKTVTPWVENYSDSLNAIVTAEDLTRLVWLIVDARKKLDFESMGLFLARSSGLLMQSV